MGSNDNSYNAQRLNPMRTGSFQRTSGNTSSSLGHTGSTQRTGLSHTGSSLPTSAEATNPTVGQPQSRSEYEPDSASYTAPAYGAQYDPEENAWTAQYATRTPYVRKPRPRKTQEAIDDLADDNTPSATYAHDSNVAVGGVTPLAGRPYSRSRSDMGKLQRDLHYGQYLEIPKGKRQIFASRERSRQIRSRIVIGVILVVLVLVAAFAFSLLSANA